MTRKMLFFNDFFLSYTCFSGILPIAERVLTNRMMLFRFDTLLLYKSRSYKNTLRLSVETCVPFLR
jgi:hypothetical protein